MTSRRYSEIGKSLAQVSFEHLSRTDSSIPALAPYLRCHVSPSRIDLWQDWHIMIGLAGMPGAVLVSSEQASSVLPIRE